MPQTSAASPGLLLSDDLLFTSRVTGTAKALGRTILPATTVDALLNLVTQKAPHCILVDLAFPNLALDELFAAICATCSDMPRVVAYGSHVDAAGLRAARAAGCDPVLPRSKFVEELPTQLIGWLDN
jgi:CheY-like chemotaxis protein